MTMAVLDALNRLNMTLLLLVILLYHEHSEQKPKGKKESVYKQRGLLVL